MAELRFHQFREKSEWLFLLAGFLHQSGWSITYSHFILNLAALRECRPWPRLSKRFGPLVRANTSVRVLGRASIATNSTSEKVTESLFPCKDRQLYNIPAETCLLLNSKLVNCPHYILNSTLSLLLLFCYDTCLLCRFLLFANGSSSAQ